MDRNSRLLIGNVTNGSFLTAFSASFEESLFSLFISHLQRKVHISPRIQIAKKRVMSTQQQQTTLTNVTTDPPTSSERFLVHPSPSRELHRHIRRIHIIQKKHLLKATPPPRSSDDDETPGSGSNDINEVQQMVMTTPDGRKIRVVVRRRVVILGRISQSTPSPLETNQPQRQFFNPQENMSHCGNIHCKGCWDLPTCIPLKPYTALPPVNYKRVLL